MGCAISYRSLRSLGFACCLAALLFACAAKDDEPDVPAGMSVSATLRDVHRCSRISPELLIAAIPDGTEYFDVRLMEYASDGREVFLGGGTWDNDASGVIPEGALSRHYRGPCAPAGQKGDFAFVVSAMSKKSMQPLAVRLYRFTQE